MNRKITNRGEQPKNHGVVRKLNRGFTLIELMITIAIVAILAAIAVDSYRDYIIRSQLTELAQQFSQYERAFEIWRQVHGDYPSDTTKGKLPADADGLDINLAIWQSTTMVGGSWNWEGPNNHSYAGIAISDATSPEEDLIQLDTILDDGDLGSGRFRKIDGDYTYIID